MSAWNLLSLPRGTPCIFSINSCSYVAFAVPCSLKYYKNGPFSESWGNDYAMPQRSQTYLMWIGVGTCFVKNLIFLVHTKYFRHWLDDCRIFSYQSPSFSVFSGEWTTWHYYLTFLFLIDLKIYWTIGSDLIAFMGEHSYVFELLRNSVETEWMCSVTWEPGSSLCFSI